MRQLKISNIWKGARIVVIPKPEKPWGDSKSYRPISLLCVPFKILERLIYAPVEPIMTHSSHKSRRAFDTGSAGEQVTLLT